MSRTTWRWAVMTLGGALIAMGAVLGVILARPDARRSAPSWSDEFEGESGGWVIDEGGSLRDGRLLLSPIRPGSPAEASHELASPDFVAETQARVLGGSVDNGYGLVVGGDTADLAFLVGGDGYFSVMLNAGQGWMEVQPWRPWPHIRRGDRPNVLRLECAGGVCVFYVNEEFTLQRQIEWQASRVGLIAWRYTPEGLTIAFEYLRVWAKE